MFNELCNEDIRSEVKAAGLKLWHIAYALGIKNEGNFSRKLRLELSAEEKTQIRTVIQQLSAANNKDDEQ